MYVCVRVRVRVCMMQAGKRGRNTYSDRTNTRQTRHLFHRHLHFGAIITTRLLLLQNVFSSYIHKHSSDSTPHSPSSSLVHYFYYMLHIQYSAPICNSQINRDAVFSLLVTLSNSYRYCRVQELILTLSLSLCLSLSLSNRYSHLHRWCCRMCSLTVQRALLLHNVFWY